MRHLEAFFLVLCSALVLSSAAFAGSVTGTVKLNGTAPKLDPIDMRSDPSCVQKHDAPVPSELLVLGDGNTLGNVFVQVKNPPAGDYKAPGDPVVIDQNGCIYMPHVAGAMAGQPILFKNSDGILHNVHGVPKENPEFNIGMPPMLKEQKQVLNKPEPLFKVKCDVHPWMNSYIAVMTHPFFTVTDRDGKFEIGDLPDGDYEVEAWHEKLGTQTLKVTVQGGAATADFSFTRAKR